MDWLKDAMGASLGTFGKAVDLRMSELEGRVQNGEQDAATALTKASAASSSAKASSEELAKRMEA